MAVTVSKANNIKSPDGNALAVYKDSSTNRLFVKDINGKTSSLDSIIGVEGLQDTLDAGNTATQDMSVNGNIVFGASNTLSGTNTNVLVSGDSNTSSNNSRFFIHGFQQPVSTSTLGFVSGDRNEVSNSDSVGVIGTLNNLRSDSSYSIALGSSNQLRGQNNFFIGKNNEQVVSTYEGNDIYMIGDNNEFQGTSLSGASVYSFAIGRSNIIKQLTQYLIGVSNNGGANDQVFAFGGFNTNPNDTEQVFMVGQDLTPSDNTKSFNVGYFNLPSTVTGYEGRYNIGVGRDTSNKESTIEIFKETASPYRNLIAVASANFQIGTTSGNTFGATTNNNLIIGSNHVLNSGTRSLVGGFGTQNAGDNALVFGISATNSGDNGIALGNTATVGVGHDDSVAIGLNSSTSASSQTAIGGDVLLNAYGSGTKTGTTAYNLAVDSSGNIIETTDAGGSVTSIATTSPITGGTITTSGTIGITQADATTDGYLSSTDWNTFNNKGSGTVTSVQFDYGVPSAPAFQILGSPITGSGLIQMLPLGTASQIIDGLGQLKQRGTFTETGSSVLSITNSSNFPVVGTTTIRVIQATSGTSGYLSSTDWNTFNNKTSNTGTVTSVGLSMPSAFTVTNSPVTTTGTLTVTGAGTSAQVVRGDGSLGSYTTGTVQSIGTTAPITGGTITSTGTIGISQSGASSDGYLSSTDWNTFNNKTSNTGTVTSVAISNGGGITVSGSPITTSGTITLTNSDKGSSQDIFKTIAVSGQSDIVADSNNDTLTFVAGTGITITTDATTDEIEITNSGATGTVTSVGLSMPSAFSVTNSPVTTSGTLTVTGAGTTSQYIRGDGTLATYDEGTVTSIGTTAPITGGTITSTGTIGITQADSTTDGYLSSTDWNTFNNKTSNTGTVTSVGASTSTTGTDFTISNSPITTSGTLIFNLPVASATNTGKLSSTDWTTFNNKTSNTGTVTSVGLGTGTSGTDVNVTNSPITTSGTITLNIPVASASNTGKLSSTDWSTFNSKIGGSGTANTYALFSASGTITSTNSYITNGSNAGSVVIGGGGSGTGTSEYSLAGGQNCQATGFQSLTSGFQNTASGGASASIGGAINTASGSNSVIIGGANNVASGSNSIAGGEYSTANGTRSLAIGYLCNVQSNATYQFGGGGTGSIGGDGSFYVGGTLYNTAGRIFAFGDNHTAQGGDRSFMSGREHFITGGNDNNCFGNNADVTDSGSDNNFIAGGSNEVDVGHECLIVGRNNKIDIPTGGGGGLTDSTGSIVFGESSECLVNGGGAIAGGFDSICFSRFGVAIGRGATASTGENQFAFGQGVTTPTSGTSAYGEAQFVTGIYNVYSTGGTVHRFAVGNGTSDSSRANAMNVDSNGRMGLGVTSPTFQLQLSTNSAGKPSSSSWTVTSDRRIKENIREYSKGLAEILQIETKVFDYNGKAGYPKTKDNVGVIAQEIQEIFPETVSTFEAKLNEDDEHETELLNFDSHALTFALINSVKELSAKIDELQDEINTLKA